MKLPRRRQFLHLAAGAAAMPTLSRIAWAQAYPTRPVHLLVGFAPAGAADITARLIGQWLSERLGQRAAAKLILTKCPRSSISAPSTQEPPWVGRSGPPPNCIDRPQPVAETRRAFPAEVGRESQ
jgi:hypothetical protein